MDYMSVVHDLIVNMSGSFMFCVIAFFGMIVVAIINGNLNKNCRALSVHNAKKLEYDHEINKMAEQRKLIEQQVSNRVVNVKRLGEDARPDDRGDR